MRLKELLADAPKRPLAFDSIALLFLAVVAAWNLTHPLPLKKRWQEPAPNALHQAIVARIDGAFDPPVSAWVAGLLLGDDSGFSKKWKDVFRRTGTSHLTAVSGYNVSIVLSGVQAILLRLPLRRRDRVFIGLAAVGGFVLLTGSPASVLRAAFMISLVTAAREIFGRPVKPLRALLLAALILTLFKPRILTDDRGFQLSVLATFGLCALSEPLEATVFRFLPAVLRGWAAQTAAATITTAPLIAWMTGQYSLVSLFANLAAAFFMPSLMALGAATVGLAFLSSSAAALAGSLAGPWLSLPLGILRAMAGIPFASIRGSAAFIVLTSAEAAAIALAAFWWRRRGRTHLLYAQDEVAR